MSDPAATSHNPSIRRTAQARRERIIGAARELFAQNGFDKTGMAQIAKESQVLVGQIYRDFAGKEDLIAAIVERDVLELLDDPELTGAIESGEAIQLNNWVRRFIGRGLDDTTRKVLSDILSEGTRNPRIAAILTEAHDRLSARIAEAALIWIPEPGRSAEREALADLILTMSGAVQHRRIFGLPSGEALIARMVAIVEAEIERSSGRV